ncbi:MAG: hypothetical protein ACLP9L_08195, partial [Thermoguttaceae bacterium]
FIILLPWRFRRHNTAHSKKHFRQQAARRQALAIVPVSASSRILRIRIRGLPHTGHAPIRLYGKGPRVFCRSLPRQNTPQPIVHMPAESGGGQALVGR